MRVLCIPQVRNKFFALLCRELACCGCTVLTDTRELWKNPFSYDILHIHFPEAFYEWGNEKSRSDALKAAHKFMHRLEEIHNAGVKIIWTAHNLKSHRSLYPDLDMKIYGAVVEHSDAIILHCNRAKSLIENRYPASQGKIMRVIPHGNYIGSYPNSISRQEARNILGLSNNDFLFLHFGQLQPYKRVDLLIKAFNMVCSERKNVKFLIVGEVPSRFTKCWLKFHSLLNRRIVVYPEYVPDDKVQVYLNAADVAVFAYSDILTSGAAILAMSFGLPVIAPDVGCMREYVRRDWGLLFRKGDVKNLKEQLLKATELDITEMGRKAWLFQKTRTWNEVARKTVDLYQELMDF